MRLRHVRHGTAAGDMGGPRFVAAKDGTAAGDMGGPRFVAAKGGTKVSPSQLRRGQDDMGGPHFVAAMKDCSQMTNGTIVHKSQMTNT